MIYRLLIFLALNFAALAIGGMFTGMGVPSAWYQGLHKAPWTPPGWVFGAAWTLIMICFGIFMALAWPLCGNKKMLLSLFVLQWILNVAWNPVFFYFHKVFPALVLIVLLSLLLAFILFYFLPMMKLRSLWLLPYLVWLLIAVSLNAYIWVNNSGGGDIPAAQHAKQTGGESPQQ